jgi:anti-sigma-K factor RskA
MAERTESQVKSTPAKPVWRRRRFWQLVIAIEIVVALVVSYAAEPSGDGALSRPQGLPSLTSGGI